MKEMTKKLFFQFFFKVCLCSLVIFMMKMTEGHAFTLFKDYRLKKAIQSDVYNIEDIKFLLNEGANPNLLIDNKSALMRCIEANRIDIAHLLLEKNADVHFKDHLGNTPLSLAASRGLTYLTQKLLESGANIDEMNNRGLTPLHLAINHLKTETAQTLIAQGANLDMADLNGNLPLMLASDKGLNELVVTLLHKNVPINARNLTGLTALHQAVKSRKFETALILILEGASKEIDIDLEDDDGNTPLMALSSLYPYHAAPDSSALTLALIEKGADIHFKKSNGATPLIEASKVGNHNMALILIEKGALIDIKDNQGHTPLILAIKNRAHGEMAHFLIDHGANLDFQDSRGDSPLSWAAFLGMKDLVIKLIGKGASLNIKNENGFTALGEAVNKDHNEIAKILIANGAGSEDIINATKKNNVSIMRKLINLGISVQTKNENGDDLLAIAADKRNVEAFHFLLEQKVELDSQVIITPDFFLKLLNSATARSLFIEKYFSLDRFKNISFKDITKILNDFRLKAVNTSIFNMVSASILKKYFSYNSSLESLKLLESYTKEKGIPYKDIVLEARIRFYSIPELENHLRHELDSDENCEKNNGKDEITNKMVDSNLEDLVKSPQLKCLVCHELAPQFLSTSNKNTLCDWCICDFEEDLKAGKYYYLSYLCPPTKYPTESDFQQIVRKFKLNQDQYYKMKKIFLQERLATNNNFKFCKAKDCFNGKIHREGNSFRLPCKICENNLCIHCGAEQDHQNDIDCLTYKNGEDAFGKVVHNPKSSIHPCPYEGCYAPTEKSEACDHMRCRKCQEDWDWKLGRVKNAPAHYSKPNEERTYRIPGDVNQKTGKIYTDYKENIRYNDDH